MLVVVVLILVGRGGSPGGTQICSVRRVKGGRGDVEPAEDTQQCVALFPHCLEAALTRIQLILQLSHPA